MSLSVQIVTPRAVAWSGTASDVQAPGLLGEFGVFPKHIPFLTVLTPGIARVRVDGKVKAFAVGEGFAEAGPDRVVLLVDSCEALEDVDRAAAQQDLADAEAVLRTAADGTVAHTQASRKAKLARARLG
ncbi:MAG: F-type H+-transporting ATPase subunit epsilon [Pseudomonadota bacterium]|jgi:F-type H+-transporting ATPase subunit epsilon